MESMNGLGAGFENYDEPMYFNMLNKSFERGAHSISQEFMKNSEDQQNKQIPNTFRSFNPVFQSNEFGNKIFEGSQEQPRNILHPTPKYHNS